MFQEGPSNDINLRLDNGSADDIHYLQVGFFLTALLTLTIKIKRLLIEQKYDAQTVECGLYET